MTIQYVRLSTLGTQSTPKLKFEYTVGMENAEQSGITEEDVVRQLNTQMLAGTSPDILILDGLSADSMIEQGDGYRIFQL